MVTADDGAEQDVRVAAEVLRRAVQDEVRAVLERAQVDGRRGSGVDEHRGGMRCGGLEVGHRQERVRGRLEPDELDAVRRRARLVELDVLQAPPLEDAEHRGRAEVTALGDRDRVPGPEQGEHTLVAAPVPDGKRRASPPSSSPSAFSAATPVG